MQLSGIKTMHRLAFSLTATALLFSLPAIAQKQPDRRTRPQVTSVRGGATVETIFRSSADSQFFDSPSFRPVFGTATTVKVLPGEKAIIAVGFFAETNCYQTGPGVGSWCPVKITIGGSELYPQTSDEFALDSSQEGQESVASWEGHGMVRHSRVLGPGSYTIRVRAAAQNDSTEFRVDDWTLRVEKLRVN